MANLVDISTVAPLEVWGDTVQARRIEGERITLALVELAPNALVPEHRHPAEQLGLVIRGSVHFRIDDEERDLGPGGTWRILSDHPHEVRAGPDGAVVVDVFNPTRADWAALRVLDVRPPAWPAADAQADDAPPG
ncbi:MAG TPA: cupin domain-containing protein [Candidatus Limnocylindrales bacterium]|nr:cupin domain-containing protein [Candidatus Limnocylindrales bacterium]